VDFSGDGVVIFIKGLRLGLVCPWSQECGCLLRFGKLSDWTLSGGPNRKTKLD